MIDGDMVHKLKERYPQLHPLLFHRSVERARDAVDLFDILESLVTHLQGESPFPLVWDEEQRQWVRTLDLFQSAVFLRKTEA